MDTATKILIVGGVLNLAYGFLTGFVLGNTRMKSPEAPKYLVLAHTGPLIQGPMLLGLVFAVDLSPLAGKIETLAASLLVASSAFLHAGNSLHWLQGVRDEFAERPPGFFLVGFSTILAVAGLAILVVGVFDGL